MNIQDNLDVIKKKMSIIQNLYTLLMFGTIIK